MMPPLWNQSDDSPVMPVESSLTPERNRQEPTLDAHDSAARRDARLLQKEAPRYIAIEGPIRVGKSTLAQHLSEYLGADLMVEAEDNQHLPDFYAGQHGSAFRAQMSFLVQRYRQLWPLGRTRLDRLVVADYIFEKDKIFAYINLSDDELNVYEQYYQMFRPQLGTPELVIYLQARPEVLKQRVTRKGVPEEQQISFEYLEEVVKAYDHFFFHYSQSDLLVVNTSEIDFVRNEKDLRQLLRRLDEPVRGTEYYHPLASHL